MQVDARLAGATARAPPFVPDLSVPGSSPSAEELDESEASSLSFAVNEARIGHSR
jgi:hypothetical protein